MHGPSRESSNHPADRTAPARRSSSLAGGSAALLAAVALAVAGLFPSSPAVGSAPAGTSAAAPANPAPPAAPALAAKAPDPRFDQSDVPLEVLPADPAAVKVVFIAGPPVKGIKSGEHEWFAGVSVLADLVRQTKGVHPVVVRDWPTRPETLAGAKAVVLLMEGGGKQTYLSDARMAELGKLVDAGAGLVVLHQAIDHPRAAGAKMLPWLGGYWDKEIGCRGHWVADCTVEPSHPVARGVKTFRIDDGWIFNLKFMPDEKAVTPLIKLVPPEKLRTTADAKSHPGRAEVMSWAFQRAGGGRSFVFVGGHLHSSFADESYRRFLTNGVLWSAGLGIPAEGAPVALDAAVLERRLDNRPPVTPKTPPKTPKTKT